jgi:putative ABC transport system ATP-binding protein
MVDGAIGRVGLTHRATTLASRLSGGERQLAAVARAVVGTPRLLLADEPTGSVDSATGARIVQLILDFSAATGATVVLVTHEEAVARRLDRVVVMRDGLIADAGRRAPS